jgi:cyclophilin family peptidyl-prolyl cis-trans isomerase
MDHPEVALKPMSIAFAFVLSLLVSPLHAQEKPKVTFDTTMGTFTVELEPMAAPQTVMNFLQYVRSGHYRGTTFHRVIRDFMVQGGGYDYRGNEKRVFGPIENEAKRASAMGLINTRGTIAMARTANPHTATAQFFVNVVDNPALDPAHCQDGWGYCVFGRVTEGMDVIDAICAVETGKDDRPFRPIVIRSAMLVQ